MTTLLAANDGGHIRQLHSLHARFYPPDDDRLWITVPTPQTESLLAGEQVRWVRPAPTRDWRAAIRNAAAAYPVFKRYDITRAVSTGSSLAISALPHAALRGIPAHYIESVTRTDGPSLSGRMLQRLPRVALYAQWPHLAGGRWRYNGSVLDGYEIATTATAETRRIVVSLGTSSRFGFRRLLERLVAILPTGVEVLWQTGSTDVSGLGIDARPLVPGAELEAAMCAADAVVAHAGAGIAITALDAGKVPVLVPRRASRREHVDDHQGEIARHLAAMHLARVADADDLRWETITSSSKLRARQSTTSTPFLLDLPARNARASTP